MQMSESLVLTKNSISIEMSNDIRFPTIFDQLFTQQFLNITYFCAPISIVGNMDSFLKFPYLTTLILNSDCSNANSHIFNVSALNEFPRITSLSLPRITLDSYFFTNNLLPPFTGLTKLTVDNLNAAGFRLVCNHLPFIRDLTLAFDKITALKDVHLCGFGENQYLRAPSFIPLLRKPSVAIIEGKRIFPNLTDLTRKFMVVHKLVNIMDALF
jgi:hypothetical protein